MGDQQPGWREDQRQAQGWGEHAKVSGAWSSLWLWLNPLLGHLPSAFNWADGRSHIVSLQTFPAY